MFLRNYIKRVVDQRFGECEKRLDARYEETNIRIDGLAKKKADLKETANLRSVFRELESEVTSKQASLLKTLELIYARLKNLENSEEELGSFLSELGELIVKFSNEEEKEEK